MRKLIFIFFLLPIACLFSQNDYKPMQAVDAFKKKLTEASASVSTIESDFTQIKHLSVLSEDVTSKGKFYYQKTDKIRLEYTTPVAYLIVINGKKIKITSGGKSNTHDIGSNPSMKQMNQLLTACMTGNMDLLGSDYRIEYKENASSWLLTVMPFGTGKKYINTIDIYLDKKDFSVQRLKMGEPSGDYTEYVFTNKKSNVVLPDEKFNIK